MDYLLEMDLFTVSNFSLKKFQLCGSNINHEILLGEFHLMQMKTYMQRNKIV